MVETAIVLPLFIFMIMGMIQFTLLYQARSMLKYAAYRAARAGALNNGCRDKMEQAARAVLVPVVDFNGLLLKANNPGNYIASYAKTSFNKYPVVPPIDIVGVRICGPLQSWLTDNKTYKPNGGNQEVDFDDAANVYAVAIGSGDAAPMRGYERTRLRVQLRFNYELFIPFVNSIIFKTWTNERVLAVARMGKDAAPKKHKVDIGAKNGARPEAEGNAMLKLLAAKGRYFMPLYANYGFRMQSNFFLNSCPMPRNNECWHYKEPSASAGDP